MPVIIATYLDFDTIFESKFWAFIIGPAREATSSQYKALKGTNGKMPATYVLASKTIGLYMWSSASELGGANSLN